MSTVTESDLARFWSKTAKDPITGCVLWTGHINNKGYGKFWLAGSIRYAHRAAWLIAHGPIPDGRDLDHTCWTPACVNVDHLRVVTHKQNQQNRASYQANNTSGYRGVHFNAVKGRWQGTVTRGGKRFFVGYFDTAEEAGEATRQRRLELFTHNNADRIAS